MNKLNVSLLGYPKIKYNEIDITENLSSKSVGLLCYLAVNHPKGVLREKLSSMFWEGSTEKSAKYNLRYNIWSINKLLRPNRKDIEDAVLVSKRSVLEFADDINVYCDVNEMMEIYSHSKKLPIVKLLRIKELCTNDFLMGFYIKRCFDFNDWVFYEREQIQTILFSSLSKINDYYEKEGCYSKQVETLEEMIRINVFDEDIYAKLIKIHIKQNNISAALNQYNRCEVILREELSISPKLSTKLLLEEIKSARNKNSSRDTNKKQLTPDDNRLGCLIKKISSTEMYNLYKENRDEKYIMIECVDIFSIKYYYLSILLDSMIEIFGKDSFSDFPKQILMDLNKVSPLIECDFDNECIRYSNDLEKIRIFQAVRQVMKRFTCDKETTLLINNIDHMDDDSFEFIMFLCVSIGLKNLKITYSGDIDSHKVQEIQKLISRRQETL